MSRLLELPENFPSAVVALISAKTRKPPCGASTAAAAAKWPDAVDRERRPSRSPSRSRPETTRDPGVKQGGGICRQTEVALRVGLR